jgi:hypothetical protein
MKGWAACAEAVWPHAEDLVCWRRGRAASMRAPIRAHWQLQSLKRRG